MSWKRGFARWPAQLTAAPGSPGLTEVNGTEHDIEIDHSTTTGKGTVLLDGKEVGDARMLGRKKEIEFDIDGHPGKVTPEAAYGASQARARCTWMGVSWSR